MSEWAIIAACTAAIAIGWFLGRFPFVKLWRLFKYRSWRKSYMQGLNFLLNEEPDQSIEEFIRTWDVNTENFDLHNALANMLRRKGEVDRAIPIHANLVNAKLPKAQIRLATIELAQDYMAAGLLDRAERLLINVVNHSKDFEEKSLDLLQQVYQLEKEWQKAIAIAEQLVPKRSVVFNKKAVTTGKHAIDMAQYYCEIASEALNDDSFKVAQEALERALEIDALCARATLLKAQLMLNKGNSEYCIAILDELTEQDPSLLVESLELLVAAYADNTKALIEHLSQWLESYPSVQIERTLFESYLRIDEFEANEFLAAQIKSRPTLKGLDLFIGQQLEVLSGSAKENLLLLHRLVKDVLKDRAAYQCKNCGFSGKQLHWLCPKCQSWNSIRRIRGSVGD